MLTVACWKCIFFFKSLQFFQRWIIWITFGWAIGENLEEETSSYRICLSGAKICAKICPWNPFRAGGNLRGQVKNLFRLAWGKKMAKACQVPSSTLRCFIMHYYLNQCIFPSIPCRFQIYNLFLVVTYSHQSHVASFWVIKIMF